MRSVVQPMADNFQKEHRSKRRWQKVFTVLAAVVVFCTTYALILPAITWERSLICELPEHTHTDACFEEIVVDEPDLICEREEHTHGDACYEQTTVLGCGVEEHRHSDDCYIIERVLTCDDSTHEHTDACYEEIRTLACGREEHVHDSGCYVTEYVLACDKPEHTHTAECYSTALQHVERVAVCGMEEHTHTDACFDAPPAQAEDGYYCGYIAHRHDASCYFEDGTLRCTIPEHVHTDICESDPRADVEDAAFWETTFANVRLSGVWEQDVLAIADSQLGYCESPVNFEIEDGMRKGYTRYGDWYGIPYGDWCAMFCSFCINYAQVKDFPIDCACQRWTVKLNELELYHPAGEDDYIPKPGDLVFFDWNWYTEETRDERVADHVAFVYEVTPADEYSAGKLKTIEGNWGSSVCYVERDLDDDCILGWGEMPQNPELEEAVTEPDLEYIKINVAFDSSYIYLTPDFGSVDTNSYSWQWQYSENGGEPWIDIPNANGLTHWLVYSRYNASHYFRIVGTKTVVTPVFAPVLFASGSNEPDFSAPVLNAGGTSDEVIVSGAVSPLLADGATVETYWRPITSTSELTSDGIYILVTRDRGIALNGANASTNTVANMAAAPNKPGYFTTELGSNYWWTVNQNRVQNVGSGKYLRLDSSPLINSNTGTTLFSYRTDNANNSAWDIYNGNYHLNYSNGTFSRLNNNGSYKHMLIYKQETVTVSINGSVGSSDISAVKPDYPDYLPVTGALNGDTEQNGIEGNYYSDPATSQLESILTGVTADDGRVLTDKSVIYGDDDYGAFSTYEPNTFGVELSALGQTYSLQNEFVVQTPLDVVFIYDCSGSMTDNLVDGESVANISVKALNQAMAQVLDANPDNRVGVVCFSNTAKELLPLGRYAAPGNEFFPEGLVAHYDRDEILAPNSSITRTDGKPLVTGSWNEYWGGTFTQEGIALGAQTFLNESETTVTRTVTKELEDGTITATYTANRKPLIILLSDGEPTYCTQDYMNVLGSTVIHGSGDSGYNKWYNSGTELGWDDDLNINNNKGIHGFYTILSANYYKQKVAEHYNTSAYFYTIGLAIAESGNDSYSISASGDDYKRAILNPTSENIAHLADCTGGWCYGYPQVPLYRRDISPLTDITCRQLYQLLNNGYAGSTVTVGPYDQRDSNRNIVLHGLRAMTTTTVPVMPNPYAGNYNYADGAAIVQNASVDGLVSAFSNAISFAENIPVYGFILKSNTPLEISDTIGDGMEIKGEPVLRYNGQNFQPAGEPTVEGNVTTYHYTGIVAATDINGDPDGSGRAADISEIIVEVINNNGKQTVRMLVPDDALPAYSPNLNKTGIPEFYYEELPVRLIYQVGLTEQSKTDIGALAGTGDSLTYYTNAWTDNDYAYSDYQPTANNPYYKDDDYSKTTKNKSENTTGTSPSYILYDEDSDAELVNKHLGNNGKLVFTSERYDTVPLVIRKLDIDGEPITTDTAKFELFSDAECQHSLGIYETDETGTLTIPGLRVDRTYYLKEIEAPLGYEPVAGAKAFTIDEGGVISGPAADEFFNVANIGTGDDKTVQVNVINDFGHVSVSAEKRWSELLNGEVRPASVQFQLYADGEPYGQPVTLDSSNDWKYTWSNLRSVSIENRHEIEYTVQEVEVEGYVAQTRVLQDGTVVITNQKLTPTSISAYKKWEGGIETSIQIELLRNGEATGEYATLNADNGWWYEWTDLPDYDENGPLEYSVREFVPAGYDSLIHQWTGPGDPYGLIGSSTYTASRAYSFENGKRYILTYAYYSNNRYQYDNYIASNGNKNGLEAARYANNTTVTDRMLWEVSKNGNAITFTNVYSGSKLVLDNNNRLALGTSGHATSWTYVQKDAWQGDPDYTLAAQYGNNTYYFNAGISGGTGATSTNGWMFVYPYVYENSLVDDGVQKDDTHYYIVNTRQETPPGDLTLSFTKVDSEDDTALTGAVFALYRETGNEGDTLIPGTSDRYGVSYIPQWTSDGTAKTVTVTQNGTYYLVEVSPPDGYKPLTEPIVFEVTSGGSSRAATVIYHPEMESGAGFTDMDIPNELFETYALPETGGAGILPIYALGVLLMAGAVMCGSFSRRKRERRNN